MIRFRRGNIPYDGPPRPSILNWPTHTTASEGHRTSCSQHVHGAGQVRLRSHRRGMIVAVVLVALVVVMLLAAALVNVLLAQRQLVRHSRQEQQAFWLAESALHHATHRLVNEDEYAGEVWQVPPDDLGGKHGGVAVIRIETVSEPQPGHRIIIDASYPSVGLKKIAQHRELFISAANQ